MNRRPEFDSLLFERPPLHPHLNPLPEGEEREATDLETGGRYFALPKKRTGGPLSCGDQARFIPLPEGEGRVRARRPTEMRSRTLSNPLSFFLFLSQGDSAEVRSWSWIELDPRLVERSRRARRTLEALAAARAYLISSVVDPFDKLRTGFTTATSDEPTASSGQEN
jgi:hypothetical protein